ncbi:MAG: HI0074 family nucleotidyltransferase substrate-binding subunit [Paludibacter sp.]|nr:HI0074 family nucleotidyltransferase substrate-binding subunit [Paludibacter sp.]
MTIDLSSLQKAIKKLTTNNRLLSQADQHQQETKEAYEDACIQAFEYTYELCHKMLKRCLEQMEANIEDIDRMSFPDLIRKGAEKGLLLHSWDKWTYYRLARNKTSHTYDSETAQEVLAIISDFLEEANYLFEQIIKRNV